jgi:adenylate kinase
MNRRAALSILTAVPAFAQAQPDPRLVIILIGPPGSGKSTQAAYLQKRRKLPLVTLDDIKDAPDAKAIPESRKRVKAIDWSKGFILDGYPRSRAQADDLGVFVRELKLPAPIVIQLDVPDDVARQRVQADKNYPKANFESELARYHRELEFARSYYPEADIWTVIGNKTPLEVRETIEMLIRDRLQ